MNPFEMFKKSISLKLVVLLGGTSVLVLTISLAVTAFIVKGRVIDTAGESLKAYNNLLYTMLENSYNDYKGQLSRNAGAALAECNRIYRTYPGAPEARITAYLNSLDSDGKKFTYAFNSKGIIKAHPDVKLVNTSIENESFIQTVTSEKNGIKAYEWKPSGKENILQLVSAYVYFKPLDIYICVTENQDAVLEGAAGLKLLFKTQKILENGYPYILSSTGRLIVHPESEGEDISGHDFIRRMLDARQGVESYNWNGAKKISVYRHFPPLDWIIASESHFDDFAGSSFKIMFMSTALIVTAGSLLLFLIIYRITYILVSRPVKKVKALADAVIRKDFSVTITSETEDEIGLMTSSVSKMLEALKTIVSAMAGKIDRLSETSAVMEEISNKMSVMSQDQASAMEQTSAALEETQASMEQITGRTETQYNNVDKNAHKMSQMAEEAKNSWDESLKVAGFMSETAKEASNGEQGLNLMVDEMQNIKESTSKIAEIIKIISDISEQVNLLSLNAAIEAARAGDHGRGFAVVADEISKLADETASSAKIIAALVQEGNARVDSGTVIVNRTARTFHQIIESIEGVTSTMSRFSETLKLLSESSSEARGRTDGIKQIANEISVAAGEQMATTKDISRTIEKVNESSQELVSFADSILKTAEEIGAISRLLKDQLGDIKY
jgi:methyl-accepting chemotaxis protein